MEKHNKLEKLFTIFVVICAVLFISSIFLDIFGVIKADIMIQGFILAFMLVSIGVTSLKSSKLLGIICFIVSIFIIIGFMRFYSPFIWFKF